MPRPPKQNRDRRGRPVGIRLTPAEGTAIRTAAEQAGVSPAAFMRRAALDRAADPAPLAAPPDPDPSAALVRRELRRIGANLNQALKVVHTTGDTADLRDAIRDVRAAIEEHLVQ